MQMHQDTYYADVHNGWRPDVFVYFFAMFTIMKYDSRPGIIPVHELIADNVGPLMGAYWFCSLLMLPIAFLPCLDSVAHWIMLAFSPVLWLGLGPFFPLGHGWYVGIHLFFCYIFNCTRELLNRVPGSCCECCWQCRSAACCDCGEDARATPPRTTRQLVLRLLWTCPLMYTVGSVPGLSHILPPFRMPQCYIGCLIGQACLHVELDEAGDRWLGRIADVMTLIFVILAFEPSGVGQAIIYYLGDVPLAFLLFALCRTRHSRAARAFASKKLQFLAPYTYVLFLAHPVVIHWAMFARAHGMRGWTGAARTVGDSGTWHDGEGGEGVFTFDYTSAECDWVWQTYDEQTPDEQPLIHAQLFAPYEYISMFCVAITGSILVTLTVHDPWTRWWAGFLARHRHAD